MTWSGGTAGVGHTDWESLRGRKVALWPDADEPGLKAMRELAQKLSGIAAEVKMVLPPPGVPSGWDLADELPIGFNLRAHAKSAMLVANSAPVAVAVAKPAQAGARLWGAATAMFITPRSRPARRRSGKLSAVMAATRCWELFEMRSFIPLSEEISMESTVEPSSISISFFT